MKKTGYGKSFQTYFLHNVREISEMSLKLIDRFITCSANQQLFTPLIKKKYWSQEKQIPYEHMDNTYFSLLI